MQKVSYTHTHTHTQCAEFAPVVLFVYSRPEHTKRTIETLAANRLARETRLYVFCDAPNPLATEEQERDIKTTHNYLSWIKEQNENDRLFADIRLEISIVHRGAGKAIIRGITEVLQACGRCIVLENDMEVSPYFLEHMNTCLTKYENDKKIYGIAGTSYNIKLPWWYKNNLYLLPRTESWGWATWKDRWENVDWEVKDYDKLKHSKRLQRQFNQGGNDLYTMLADQMEGRTDTWDLQWCWHVFKQKGYFVYSKWCFVHNMGFDGSGRHCGTNNTIQHHFAPMYNEQEQLAYPALYAHKRIIERFRRYHNKHISFIKPQTWKTIIKTFLRQCKIYA